MGAKKRLSHAETARFMLLLKKMAAELHISKPLGQKNVNSMNERLGILQCVRGVFLRGLIEIVVVRFGTQLEGGLNQLGCFSREVAVGDVRMIEMCNHTAMLTAVKPIQRIDGTNCVENRVIGTIDRRIERSVFQQQLSIAKLTLCPLDTREA